MPEIKLQIEIIVPFEDCGTKRKNVNTAVKIKRWLLSVLRDDAGYVHIEQDEGLLVSGKSKVTLVNWEMSE